MGVPALWDTIRRHEAVIPIAQLAEDHYRRHGKPLRIAVDEADWRFNNLTPQQVFMIREISNQQAFQGIEKAMFYRLCRLLTLNIQLIFVFDGPRRPWKRGKRGQGRINYGKRRLFQELLKYLGVPYHEAPGEAEAECARMQILGIVDAVWSQDSDSLMFGCTLWLHDHRVAKDDKVKDRSKENTKKNGKYVSLVRAEDLKEKHGLDREGLVLFAMLVGGDYDQNGLPQCGPGIALQAAKKGLGASLCACRNEQDCRRWVQELDLFLQTTHRGRSITVPATFPDYQTLAKYYRPVVTSDRELLESSALNLDYIQPVQEHKLLKLTSERFNIWGRLYMNWIGPILLMRDLTSREPSKPKDIMHDIRVPKQRSNKTEEQSPMRTFERKITFSPFGVSSLGRTDFEGPNFGNWNGDDKVLFDLNHRVECEMPEYWLRKILPEDVFNPSLPTPKPSSKRKRAANDAEQTMHTSNKNKKQTPHKGTIPKTGEASTSVSKKPRLSVPTTSPCVRKAQQPQELIEISDSEDEQNQHSLDFSSNRALPNVISGPHRGFDSSTSPSRAFSNITRDRYEYRMDFDVPEDEDEDFLLALQLSMQVNPNPATAPSNRGKFDDIFALREAGRSVEGASVPAWSLDETSHDLFSAISQTPSRPRGNPSPRINSSRRGVHANLAGAVLVGTPTRYPSQQANSAGSPASLPEEGRNSLADSNASAPAGDRLADIRAARLRHFTRSSVPTVKDASSNVSSTSADTSVHEMFSRNIPEGIECIDLTDD